MFCLYSRSGTNQNSAQSVTLCPLFCVCGIYPFFGLLISKLKSDFQIFRSSISFWANCDLTKFWNKKIKSLISTSRIRSNTRSSSKMAAGHYSKEVYVTKLTTFVFIFYLEICIAMKFGLLNWWLIAWKIPQFPI